MAAEGAVTASAEEAASSSVQLEYTRIQRGRTDVHKLFAEATAWFLVSELESAGRTLHQTMVRCTGVAFQAWA